MKKVLALTAAFLIPSSSVAFKEKVRPVNLEKEQ